MQGTLVLMMALSGLGCHHKKCETVMASCHSSCYASSCYSTVVKDPVSCHSSYAPAYTAGCYSSCYSSSCYSSSCYSSCYGSSCYASSCYSGGHKKHGFFAKHRRKACNTCSEPVVASCDVCSSGYAPATFGSYTPVYSSGQAMATGQAMGTTQTMMSTPTTDSVPPPPATTPAPPPPAPPATETAPPPPPPAPVTPPTGF